MKATGIVRRIDDLGRVVIPKEIRRTMRIREGDPLEIYTDRDGEVIFKKYSPIGEMNAFAGDYAETLYKTAALSTVICDRDGVIAAAGLPKKEFNDKKISPEMEEIFQNRILYVYQNGKEKLHATEDSRYYIMCAMPIIADGDVIGCVAALSDSEVNTEEKKKYSADFELEAKLISTAAHFLARQLDA